MPARLTSLGPLNLQPLSLQPFRAALICQKRPSAAQAPQGPKVTHDTLRELRPALCLTRLLPHVCILRREDLRHLPICSVDPPGCKDIDDALHIRPLPGGALELGVHIADVTHFLAPGTAMDAEAASRQAPALAPPAMDPEMPRASAEPYTTLLTAPTPGPLAHSCMPRLSWYRIHNCGPRSRWSCRAQSSIGGEFLQWNAA